MPVIEAIKEFTRKNNKDYSKFNWPDGEYQEGSPEETYPELDEEEIENFRYYVPSGDQGCGIHTIKSITVGDIPERKKLL